MRKYFRHTVLLIAVLLTTQFTYAASSSHAGDSHDAHGVVAEDSHGGHGDHHASFPLPLTSYGDEDIDGVINILKHRIEVEPFNLIATVIFLLAVMHTFMAGKFRQLAHHFEHVHEEKIKKNGRTAKDKIERMVIAKKKAQLRGMIESLSSIGVIRALPPHEINSLIGHIKKVSFSVDTEIFKKGDEGDCLYLLESGEVEVFIDDKSVATLVQGSSFGEMALLSGEPRNATIRVNAPVSAWKIEKDDFNELAKNSPALMKELKALSASRQHKVADETEWRSQAIDVAEKVDIEVSDQDRDEVGIDHAVDDVCIKAVIFDYLGEVEAIFGIWVIPLMLGMIAYFGFNMGSFGDGWHTVTNYIGHDLNFTEPVFVVIIMAVASTRPVLRFAEDLLRIFANLGGGTPMAWWFSILTLAPLLGSFITEPAAMTIGALLLSRQFYQLNPSNKLKYATLGALFVNVSVGGTLTHFAAPPVLMIAGPWEWDLMYLLLHFGWKAATGVVIINFIYIAIFKKEFKALGDKAAKAGGGNSLPTTWLDRQDPVPAYVTIVHLAVLAWTVITLHYPPLFMGGFLFFIAFTALTLHHQNLLQMKTPILVGFFLSGLKVHGELQGWWISPLLTAMMQELGDIPLLLGSATLTAFNDNAAITLLASLVPDFNAANPLIQAIPEKFDFAVAAQHAVVAGAVAGGGLTVIANAPNPAGQSILNKHFRDGVSPAGLLIGAILPTIIVIICFIILPSI